MRIIELGHLNIYLLFPFLVPLFYSFRDIAFKGIFSLNFLSHPIFETLIMFLSEVICIPFELLRIHNSKPRIRQIRQSAITVEQNILIERNKVISQPSYWKEPKIYMLISLSAAIDLICYTSISFSCAYGVIQTNNIHTEMRILPIFFMSLLSWKFLQMQIYNHHLVSIGFIGIGFLIIFTDLFVAIELTITQKILVIILFLVIHFFYSIKQINDKYLMEHKYISPFLLLFFEGVSGVILTFVTYAIAYLVECKEEWNFCTTGPVFETFSKDLKDLANNVNVSALLYLLLLLFSSSGLNIFLMLTKNYFSPSHRSVSDTMNAFFAWIVNFFFDWNNNWSFIKVIGYVFIMIGCCIFNEIILLKFWDLDKDTKGNIEDRSKKEDNEYVEINNLNNKKKEDNKASKEDY